MGIAIRKGCICESNIQVDRSFDINEFVHPACLPSKPSKIGQKCYASGWGDIKENYGSSPQAEELMFAQLSIRDYDGCFSKLRSSISYDSERFEILYNKSLRWDLCTYEDYSRPQNNPFDFEYKSICLGDLGGPFICDQDGKAAVHGIASSTSIRKGI